MKNRLLLIEDQTSQYYGIIETIRRYKIPDLDILDIGTTLDNTKNEYLDKLSQLDRCPQIIIVDYVLSWKKNSSVLNGEEITKEILSLWNEESDTFIIFISGPQSDKIKSASAKYEFYGQTIHTLCLDKSEINETMEGMEISKLRFIIEKACYNLAKNPVLSYNLHLTEAYDYPRGLELRTETITLRHFMQKEFQSKLILNVVPENFVFIIFLTDNHKGNFMTIVLYENGSICKYIKLLGHENLDHWRNKFKIEGLQYLEFMRIIYNPKLFEEFKKELICNNQNIYNELQKNFIVELNAKFDNSIYGGKHPFNKELKLIKPPIQGFTPGKKLL